MAVPYYGDFPEDHTAVKIPFNTFSSDDPSESVTVTTLIDSDIRVYKDGGATPIATDGATIVINLNSQTGAHIVTVDTSAHSDYSTGSEYAVSIEGATVDSGNINGFIGAFSIERTGGALASIKSLITTVGAAGIGLTAITDNTDEIGALGVGLTTCATATGFATPTNITSASGVVLHGDYDAAKTAAPASEYDTEMGYVTGNVALASVVGALDDAAAQEEVTTADTLMKYIKQLINILIGNDGIVNLKNAAAPANGISLSEMIRAIYDDSNDLQGNQAAWATATGFATASDVTTAHGTTDGLIGGLNNVSTANLESAVDDGLDNAISSPTAGSAAWWLHWLGQNIVTKMVVTEADGSAEMFDRSNGSLGAPVASRFTTDGTYTTRTLGVV